MSGSTPIFQRGEKYVREGSIDDNYQIIINGEIIPQEDAYLRNYPFQPTQDLGVFCIFSKEAYYKVSNYTIDELVNSFATLRLYNLFLTTDYFEDFWLDSICVDSGFSTHPELAYREKYIESNFQIDIANWNKPWSLKEYFNNFHSYINGYELKFNFPKDCGLLASDFNINGGNTPDCDVFTTFINDYGSFTLKNFLNRCIEIFKKANSEVLEKYQSSLTSYSLTERFNFPPEVKTACEQYLLYFAEFLKDVGIKVSTNISKEGQDTIFSVIPEDEKEALANIRQLLELYIRFPDSDIINQYQPGSELDFPVEKLIFQVKHLENQIQILNLENRTKALELRNKENEVDNLTGSIQDQQNTIVKLDQKLSAYEVLNTSLQNKITALRDKEPDTVTLLRYFEVKDFETKAGNFRTTTMVQDLQTAFEYLRAWVKSKDS